MRTLLILPALSLLAAPSLAQDIVKIPAKEAPTVARPDDLYTLPPGQWHFARQLWAGSEPCDAEQCEAGFTSGELVVSVERNGEFVRLIAGLRHCEAVGFSEMETGIRPGKSTRKRVARQVGNVVKGLGKSCNTTTPEVTPLDVALLFPPTLEKP